jgi:hypothetical protein
MTYGIGELLTHDHQGLGHYPDHDRPVLLVTTGLAVRTFG